MSRDVRRVPKQDRARRSVTAILDATAELLGEDDVSVTMSAIGQRAGISKAAIYRYFPDQAAVIHELATRYLAELDDQLAARLVGIGSLDDAIAAIDAIIDQFYELMSGSAAMRRIWLGGPNSVAVGDLLSDAAHKSALHLHAALEPHLRGDEAVNVMRIELMVYMARAAVEMALNNPSQADVVMREYRRSIVLTARFADEQRTVAILNALGAPIAPTPAPAAGSPVTPESGFPT